MHSSFAHSCFLRSVLQFQGSARTQGCEQNMNDNLEKSHSSVFCLPGCTYALMSSGNQMLSLDLSISPEGNISEANSLSEIFDSSTVLPHTILAHNKKPLENLGALITRLLLLPQCCGCFSALPSTDTSCVTGDSLVGLFGHQFLPP